jgi:hypothetical protein
MHLEPDDDRKGEVELLGGVDDALGDNVALHDAAKDIDEDGLDFGVAWKRAHWILEYKPQNGILEESVTIGHSTNQLRAPCKILNASQTCLTRRRGWRGASEFKSAR